MTSITRRSTMALLSDPLSHYSHRVRIVLAEKGISVDIEEYSEATIPAELADLTFTSALNDSTNSSFTYTVNDADSGVSSAVMNITVNSVNDVPVATGNTVVALEDVPLVIDASDFNFTDVEGDALASVSYTHLTLPTGNSV